MKKLMSELAKRENLYLDSEMGDVGIWNMIPNSTVALTTDINSELEDLRRTIDQMQNQIEALQYPNYTIYNLQHYTCSKCYATCYIDQVHYCMNMYSPYISVTGYGYIPTTNYGSYT